MAQYVGILDGSGNVWGVRIPDAPGCHGGGKTPEDAIADAISALREFAAHQQAKGITLSPPRRVQEIIVDREAEFNPDTGEAFVMVPLILDQARPVKANISLDAGLLEAIDEEAERRGLTRSALLTSAAIEKIGKSEDEFALTVPVVEMIGKSGTAKAGLEAQVARLRAELAASHERLARQASQFMSEMRRLSAGSEMRPLSSGGQVPKKGHDSNPPRGGSRVANPPSSKRRGGGSARKEQSRTG